MSQTPPIPLPATARPTARWIRRMGKGPVQRGLTIAALEGAVVGGFFAFTETWIGPLLLQRLHAEPLTIGLLTVIPLMGMALMGPFVGHIIARLGGNKRTVVLHCLVQMACLAGLSIPLNFPDQPWSVPLGLALSVGIGLAGAIGGPAWISWMGGLIPRRVRGRYQSRRTQLMMAVKLGFAVLFAVLFECFPLVNGAFGMQVVLIIAFCCRAVSTWLLAMQPDPQPRQRGPLPLSDIVPREEGRGFLHFLRTLNQTPLGRWTAVWAALHLGVQVAGPYYLVYMLERPPIGLGLSSLEYLALVQTSQLVRLVALPFVGHLIDIHGPAAMLRIAIAGIAVVPLVWVFTGSLPVLIAVEVLSGLAWCTAECAVAVLLFSCHNDRAERSRLIGYHQSVSALGIVVGAMLGGLLITYDVLPHTDDGGIYHWLFALSIGLRVLALILAWCYLPALPPSDRLTGLWRLIPGIQPTITLSRGLMRYFRRPEG